MSEPVQQLLGSILREAERPRLAIDVDGTLADYSLMFRLYNEHHLANGLPPAKTIQEIVYHPRFNPTHPNYVPWEQEVRPFYNKAWLEKLGELPFLGSKELPKILKAVKKHLDVELLTYRPDLTMPALKEWLKTHGMDEFPLQNIHDNSRRAHLGHSVFLDDNPGFSKSVQPQQVLLFVGACWGQEIEQKTNIISFKDVTEAAAHLHESLSKVRRSAAPERRKIAIA